MANRRLKSKMLKTRLMLKSPKLAGHIPLTLWLTTKRLYGMLEDFGMVYVKPDGGSQGKGVIRVEKSGSRYRYQKGTRIHTFSSFKTMHRSLRRQVGHTPYVVQRGIHMLRHKGRPFDFRVMVQRNPRRRWECTGTLARVAHPRKAVTNGSQGGSIYEPLRLISQFTDKGHAASILREMDHLGYLAASRIARRFPRRNELGVDIALDENLKPWILESNTIPDPCPFTLLPSSRAIRKIVAYGRAYGKKYRLRCKKAKRGR